MKYLNLLGVKFKRDSKSKKNGRDDFWLRHIAFQIKSPEINARLALICHISPSVSPDQVDVDFLSTFPEGFPFALVVEHTGVILNDECVFQKASPNDNDPFEVVEKELAFAPYQYYP